MVEQIGNLPAASRDIRPAMLLRRAAASLLAVCSLTACSQETAGVTEQSLGTTTSEVVLSGPELQEAATVQLRYVEADARNDIPDGLSQREIDLFVSNPNCTATHVGDGWLLTANHCFNAALHQGAQLYDDTYDALPDMTIGVEAWNGPDQETLKKVGRADSVVIHGDFTENDFAFVHVPAAARLPHVSLTKTPPHQIDREQTFTITGYPQNADFVRVSSQLEYIGLTSGQDFSDDYGLVDNYWPMFAFGVKRQVEHTGINKGGSPICMPGMSGSSIVDEQGIAYGDLARYGTPDGEIWNAVQQSQTQPLDAFETVCIFQPVSTTDLEEAIANMHQGPDPSSAVLYK